jgi:hypothetical protein
MQADTGKPLVTLGLRVPEEHATAIRKYAEQLGGVARVRVTPSAAGAAVIEAGLVALGLIPAPAGSKPSPTSKATAKKGTKPARKP